MCRSKCGVVKNGSDSSARIACFSVSSATQKTTTSVSRSPVSGSTASGRGPRKNRKLLAADLVDAATALDLLDARHRRGGLVDVSDPGSSCPGHAYTLMDSEMSTTIPSSMPSALRILSLSGTT